MDSVYAAQGSSRPHLDGERRCPLHFTAIGTPGYRHTIGIARVWHFINVHGFISRACIFVIMLFDTEQWRRIVPTSSARSPPGMEHMGSLRDFSSATGAQRVLWIQRAAADCLFHGRLCLRPSGDPDRHRHVAGRCEPLSLVCADLWRPAIGPVHPLPHHAQLSLHSSSCTSPWS